MEISDITIELMFDRIKSLEKQVSNLETEVTELKSKLAVFESGSSKPLDNTSQYAMSIAPSGSKRDTTKYMWNGNVYLKNRLVLAIVHHYAATHAGITRMQLKTVFDKTLQGSIGVVENVETARQRSDYTVRFFTKPEDTITLADGQMYVCTQWGLPNITNFITRARTLGYEIIELK